MGVLVTLVQAAVAFPKIQGRVCGALVEAFFEVPMAAAAADQEDNGNVFAALVLHIRTFKVLTDTEMTQQSYFLTVIMTMTILVAIPRTSICA